MTGLCLKCQKSVLETVSTTCDSGWVDAQHAKLLLTLKANRFTHPLSQVVLTVSWFSRLMALSRFVLLTHK
jgi:hypothetical protein